MTGTSSRHTGHHLSAVRFTTPISGRPSRLVCECSWSFEALPDLAFPDPHEPHNRAYLAHRRAVGVPLLSQGAGPGWRRMELEKVS